MAKAFVDGGIYMYPVLLSGLLGIGICLTYLVQALRGRPTRLGTLAWASVAGILAFGLLGTVIGVHAAIPAVLHAATDQKVALECMSAAASLYTLVFSLALASVEVLLATIAASVRANTGGRAA